MNSTTRTIHCDLCGGTMTGQKGEHRYTESGLTNVTLKDIMVYRCTKCSAVMPEIPQAGVLHHMIAVKLISKKTQLAGEEIRFLRKFCGYSATVFAEILGSSPSVISRFEKRGCGKENDRTIRLLVIAKMMRDIAGNSEPIIKNDTVEKLSHDLEKSLKEIAGRARPEQYVFSPEDFASFSTSSQESPELVGSSVN